MEKFHEIKLAVTNHRTHKREKKSIIQDQKISRRQNEVHNNVSY